MLCCILPLHKGLYPSFICLFIQGLCMVPCRALYSRYFRSVKGGTRLCGATYFLYMFFFQVLCRVFRVYPCTPDMFIAWRPGKRGRGPGI